MTSHIPMNEPAKPTPTGPAGSAAPPAGADHPTTGPYVNDTALSLATDGSYARMRHPQYVAFVLIMFGFLLQWPTIVTLVMYPILVAMYVRLARREGRPEPSFALTLLPWAPPAPPGHSREPLRPCSAARSQASLP